MSEDENAISQTQQRPQPVTADTKDQFDIDDLINRIKKTKALGLFTKLALKGDVEEIIEQATEFKADQEHATELAAVKSSFEGLVLKTITLLDDKDPDLARDIYQARAIVWNSILVVKS